MTEKVLEPAGVIGEQRLFFALWPEGALQDRLAQLARQRLGSVPGRCIDRENIHATLAFLGQVNAEGRQCIERMAGEVRAPAFTVTFDQLGWWPRPQVLWVGPSTLPEPLLALVSALNAGLRECGLEPERRPYRLHVTLARKVRKPISVGATNALEWHVDRFVLVESHLRRAGVRYVVLRSWSLQGS